jgi:hypothetical protein
MLFKGKYKKQEHWKKKEKGNGTGKMNDKK